MKLSDWTRAYLRDARESGAVETSLPDMVIEREAAKLDTEIYRLASSFVDNEFDESYTLPAGIDPEEVKRALEGDSNDAEHDALVSVAEALGINYHPRED